MRTRSGFAFATLRAAAAIALTLGANGCRLFVYDEDPYCCSPPPPEPVPAYYAPPEPVYYVPAPPPPRRAPGTYIYSPEPRVYSPGMAIDLNIRGQAPNDDFPTIGDDFPSIDDDFPSIDDSLLPPSESELSNLARQGADVPEPVGEYESIEPDEFRPTPKRESLAERSQKEKEIEDAYEKWRQEHKKKALADSKTPRYLRPIYDESQTIFARPDKDEKIGDEEERSLIRSVTAESLEMMSDDEKYRRELEAWEMDQPTPVDWSKYALTLDAVRSWFGMGPNEQAALEYMRQATEKQREYEKTKNRDLLKEAALLYEKAADRWPGPALRPREASKNPFQNPKSGTLIEEDGLFFAGECWFFYRDFMRALTCYRLLVSTYNASIYKDVAVRRLMFIGNYWVKCSEKEAALETHFTERDKPAIRTFARAKQAYEAVFLNDVSDSGLATEALFALANAYMRRGVKQGDGSFENAAYYYKQLYENYPGDKRAEDASRLAMIALHRSYQGAFYDAQPLDEARALAEAIIKSGRGNLDVAYEELENIKEEQANRLFALGQYYERRGNYASARAYYNRLVKEHPNSERASEGARAYEAIESKPAEADQLAWIRPIAPFLPDFRHEYFEEAPDAKLGSLARRDARLDKLGERDYQTEYATSDRSDAREIKTADTADAKRR